MQASWRDLARRLDQSAAAGRTAHFWLRDDDAIEPTPALDRLLELTSAFDIPVLLAVIPALTGPQLAHRLSDDPSVSVAVHGWSHANHAPLAAKKQEFGPHRAVDTMLREVTEGRIRLERLHPDRFVPVFVPPWNRIDPELAAQLPSAGYRLLSAFGTHPIPAVPTLNSTVDIMDWHGSRGARPDHLILRDICEQLDAGPAATERPIGVLTHHLVHNDTAWAFLHRLVDTTRNHPACRWLSAGQAAAALGIAL